MTLHSYLAQDRLRAIANNTALRDRTTGAAVFADISGFTALTESLRDALGTRQGAEELTRHLGVVYSALITEIEQFGGSVISFAGDAMLCWFDDAHGRGAPRAAASAFAMQAAMQPFAAIGVGKHPVLLALKVAVATGAARRFVVGDPEIQKLDAIAGATVARTATAEHLAEKGEVLVDEATVNALGAALTVQAWRTDAATQQRFAVVTQFDGTDTAPSVPTMLRHPAPNKLMAWLNFAVFEREQYGQASFLTEFRPCVALFVRFTGIDYDADSAESDLDAFIRDVQGVAARYEGVLMDITIGDKGSYAYLNFGALSTHEDDTRRAVKAAIELRNRSELELQLGISQGVLRVGAYGGATRRTFGALGDDVNLAARLMSTAATGEILLSSRVHQAVRDDFVSEPRAPLAVKGKAEPLPVFAVSGGRQQRAIRLQEPSYALPMVGRVQELQRINDKLDLAAAGTGQIVGIVAQAGLGKSRLVAEVIRCARKKGFVGYGGACQSDALTTPYQAWKGIWQAFFDLDPEQPLKKQLRLLSGEIEDRALLRVDAMPLLGIVLELSIPENDFTKGLEPKTRQSALHALLEDCLKAAAQDEPLLIVIEDMHWIDALSHDLLEGLAKALANLPVCFVLAYRPPQLARLEAPRLEALAQFTPIALHELSRAEAESAIRAKLAQLYPARGGALPIGLVDTLMARSQGNPFYLEELLNYVRDRGLDPADLNRIELPDTLHTLILSRIDQLSEQDKTTLRVASIVGRLFRADWLTGYYPALGAFGQVKHSLEQLHALDITAPDSPEPELAYLFKHIVTHEVTYESLPFATRARLHEQLAAYLEGLAGADQAAPLLEMLAFHYGRSDNTAKQIEYLRKAGEAAQKNFANDAALEFYGKLLAVFREGQANAREQAQVHLQRGRVLQLLGKYPEAESDFRAALELAGHAQAEAKLKADAQFALGKLNYLRGDYAPALEWLVQARAVHAALQDNAGLARVLIETGMVLWRKGEYAQVREILNDGQALARQAGDKTGAAGALNYLGHVAYAQCDYVAARVLFEDCLCLRREVGDKAGIAVSLNNLALVAHGQGDHGASQALHEESLSQVREMGDKLGTARSLGNLGILARAQGDHAAARALQEESLSLWREMGNMDGTAMALFNLGNAAFARDDAAVARKLYAESLALCLEMGEKSILAHALLGLGLVDLDEGNSAASEHILHSLRLHQEAGAKVPQVSGLVGMAGLALQTGDATQAARVLGAVDAALKVLDAAMDPDVQHFHGQTLAALRVQLSEAEFQAAWDAGAKWSLEEAVAMALEGEGN